MHHVLSIQATGYCTQLIRDCASVKVSLYSDSATFRYSKSKSKNTSSLNYLFGCDVHELVEFTRMGHVCCCMTQTQGRCPLQHLSPDFSFVKSKEQMKKEQRFIWRPLSSTQRSLDTNYAAAHRNVRPQLETHSVVVRGTYCLLTLFNGESVIVTRCCFSISMSNASISISMSIPIAMQIHAGVRNCHEFALSSWQQTLQAMGMAYFLSCTMSLSQVP